VQLFRSQWTVISCCRYLYYTIADYGDIITPDVTGYYFIVFISFFYICANPFVYAVKFDPVRRVLLDLVPCKKPPLEPG